MAYRIVWSEKAVQDLEKIIEYLEENWGTSSSLKFKKKLTKRIALISHYPKLHPASTARPQNRLSVLNKQISIIYAFRDEVIQIIRLFDNRTKPEKF